MRFTSLDDKTKAKLQKIKEKHGMAVYRSARAKASQGTPLKQAIKYATDKHAPKTSDVGETEMKMVAEPKKKTKRQRKKKVEEEKMCKAPATPMVIDISGGSDDEYVSE